MSNIPQHYVNVLNCVFFVFNTNIADLGYVCSLCLLTPFCVMLDERFLLRGCVVLVL